MVGATLAVARKQPAVARKQPSRLPGKLIQYYVRIYNSNSGKTECREKYLL